MRFSWSNISLENYAALHTLYSYDATDKIQQDISALSIITGKSEDYFTTCSLSKLGRYRASLHKVLNTPINPSKITRFRIGLRWFTCPDGIENFNGEHLEAVSLLKITNENRIHKYANILAAITESKLSYHSKVKLFEKMPAEIAVSICDRFLIQFGELAAKYDNSEKVSVKDNDPSRPDFRKQTISMFEHWGYFHVFFELSNRDRTKMEYWRKQSIPYIFNSLAHRKDLMDED
jgi:hypothetical protein